MSDERTPIGRFTTGPNLRGKATPTAEPMGRCPRCQRPTTLCDGHPTAEPVTKRPTRERVFGHVWGTLEPIESAEEVAALLDAMDAEAAQRSTTEVLDLTVMLAARRSEINDLTAEVERLKAVLTEDRRNADRAIRDRDAEVERLRELAYPSERVVYKNGTTVDIKHQYPKSTAHREGWDGPCDVCAALKS
jgi:hypothetical protein